MGIERHNRKLLVRGTQVPQPVASQDWADITNKPTEFPATADSTETNMAQKADIAALVPLADPATATLPEVATLLNAVVAALQSLPAGE